MRRRTTRLLVATVLIAVAPALVGAAPAAAQRPGTATAPPVTWSDCDDGYQCATVAAPLDYDQPRGRQISLSLIKDPATDPANRIGTLFVNFGGPGASGVERLRARGRWEWLFSPELRARFDLVSWDTRGVGRSSAVRCFGTEAEQQEFFSTIPAFPVGASEERAFYAAAEDLGRRCRDRNGDLLDHLSSADTARDLDLLRRAVGDSHLNYFGLSYGTYVGATYANLFPDRVRALVLDGALDFIGNATGHGINGLTKPIDTRQDVPRGIAETFDQFLRRCAAAGAAKCAFAAGGDPRTKFAELTARARQRPVVVDGESWSYTSIISTVNDNLPRPLWWADLAVQLERLYNAPQTATLGARAARPTPGEEYLANNTEAFYATNCADSIVPGNTAIYSRLGASEERRVPYFGPIGVFDYMPCAKWPARNTDRYLGPWDRWTAAPILVVNNRYDPSTPWHGARDATAELARGRLFTIEGAGHTGMFVPSTCGERVKREYLFTGALPAPGVVCAADDDPFA
ncbi:alpha/beta hydrolase [Micromonospora sp. NBC_01796]|uniref:alpha/beta hydrolase n=1 Tax=Micromonospora sp. NBC_01796 TaxID=2975987 RepID=UPI002DD85502|nr:alpha/beta hydrolase [Micromonospora sp. NBC_01796]WSA84394.1 alpha/beta hydrolase [Micromonospora sp. NBC_01796]